MSLICKCGHDIFHHSHGPCSVIKDRDYHGGNCACTQFDWGDPRNPEKSKTKSWDPATYRVVLGDKLEINGHIFVISEIETRIFQNPRVKIQPLAEFMETFTDEEQ